MKSTLRIIGYITLLWDVFFGVCLLIISESVGIIEEIPSAYRGTKIQINDQEELHQK